MQDRTLAGALRRSLGALLRRTYAHFTAEALGDDPRSRDFVVLDTLADQDADSQHELAERLGINRTIMVRLIDRLQEAGYVTRTRNPANRRSYVLSITDEGRKARDGMREAVAERDARITASLTETERQRLNELLSLLLPDPEPLGTTAYLVAQAHYRLRRMGDARLAGTGLRTRHFGSMAALEALAPCSQQRLAQGMQVTEPAAAQIVDELVRLGLVARGQDPADRRRYALELTPRGRECLAVVRDAAEGLQAEVLSLLGDEGERELRALLTELLAA
ncbi:MarR family transcriptional regulator [Nonomuraea sp. NPDC048826]|uniref:MarR family transcriptional regulator n=1 Tax=Nonomuraea sp. NPDC048826 TaxID=3364347 RepID=UPI00371B743A